MYRYWKQPLVVIAVALLFAVPVTAKANKQLYKAKLTTGAELHEVVGSSARGSAIVAIGPSGGQFSLHVVGLSGDVTGAHIHGPATASENAPILVTLCGAPGPGALATCTVANGELTAQGDLNSSLLAQWGVTPAQLQSWLSAGSLYVNVHTALNPAGEARGQLE